MSPEGRKVARLDPPTSSTLHFRRRPHPRLIPRASSSSRIAWPRKSTSLASLQPRSSASAYGGSVDLRFHCTPSSPFLGEAATSKSSLTNLRSSLRLTTLVVRSGFSVPSLADSIGQP